MIPVYINVNKVDDLSNPKNINVTITNHLPLKIVCPKTGIFIKGENDLCYKCSGMDVKGLSSANYDIMTQVKNMGAFPNKESLKEYIYKNFISTNMKYAHELTDFPKTGVTNAMGFAVTADCQVYGISIQDGVVTCDITMDKMEKVILYVDNDVVLVDFPQKTIERKPLFFKRFDPKIDEDVKGLAKYVNVTVYDDACPQLAMQINPNVDHVIPTWDGQDLKFLGCCKYNNLVLPVEVEFNDTYNYIKKLNLKLKRYIEPIQKIGAVMVGEKSKLITLDMEEKFTLKDQDDKLYTIPCTGATVDLPKGIYHIVDAEADQYINGYVIPNAPEVFLLFDEETWLQKIKPEEDYDGTKSYDLSNFIEETLIKLDASLVKNTGEILFKQKNQKIVLDGIKMKDKKLSWLLWELKKGDTLTDTLLREFYRLKMDNNGLALVVDVADQFEINAMYHLLAPIVDEFIFKVSKIETVNEILPTLSILENNVSFMSDNVNLLKEMYAKYPEMVFRIKYDKIRNMGLENEFKKRIITIDGSSDKLSGYAGNSVSMGGSGLLPDTGILDMVVDDVVDETKEVLNVFDKLKRKSTKGILKAPTKKKCLPKRLV